MIGGMTTAPSSPSYKGYRFPAEIISHAVWLYFRFSLSYRDVEELMAARGIVVTYETIRQWCHTFGQQYTNQLRRRRAQTGDKWHLDGYCQVNQTPVQAPGAVVSSAHEHVTFPLL
jgi:putative transposase